MQISDKPKCSGGLKLRYYAFSQQALTVTCTVHANPAKNLLFKWTFNGSTPDYIQKVKLFKVVSLIVIVSANKRQKNKSIFITFQHVKSNQTFNISRDIFFVWELVQSFENNKLKWYFFSFRLDWFSQFQFFFGKVYLQM